MKYVINAYAKVNLNLSIKRKRRDGYHEISSLMHSIPLCDTVSLELCEHGISIECTNKYIPTDERNIAYKAAKRYFDEIGYRGGVKIHIDKRIPLASGFGGSSTDGAAVLLGLNKALGALRKSDLVSLAAELSADMPFLFVAADKSLKGYTPHCANCEGIGEVMTKKPSPIEGVALLCTLSDKSFTSGEMYKTFDTVEKKAQKPAVFNGTEFFNDFEQVFTYLGADLEGVKSVLANSKVSLLSGSGGGVFALFDSIEKANEAKERLVSSSRWAEVYSI